MYERFMKWIKWFLGTLVVLVLIAVVLVYVMLYSQAPVYSGELKVSGLQEQVNVHFDQYGIPHIYANNEQDLYTALGYIHAQDRMFQMELLRRVGGGRLAEILGPDLLEVDKFFRTLGVSEAADRSVEHFNKNSDKDWHKASVAYLEGVNDFLLNGPTPLEYTLIDIPKEPFTPKDMYLISGYMAFSFAEAFLTDPIITRIKDEYGPEYLESIAVGHKEHEYRSPVWPISSKPTLSSHISQLINDLPVPLLKGSNAFVIGETKSKSGKVLLGNDTHIGFSQPGTWYEAHLECPGYSIYGYHIAGIPTAMVGHNRKKAWGITMFENDDIDLYRESLDPNDPTKYKYKDRWLPVKERTEVIRVKDSSDVVIKIRSGVHGPFIDGVNENISSDPEHPIAVSWTFTQLPNQLLSAFYKMNHAESMQEFQIGVSRVHAPGLNIIYGDGNGNIAMWAAGALVKRPDHVNSLMILDGSRGDDDALGYWPFAANPRNIDPPIGYISSSNDQPDTAGCGLYPGYYSPDNRGITLNMALKNKDDWDLDALKELQLTKTSSRDLEIAQLMMHEQGGEKDEKVRELIGIIKNWDGGHELESIGTTVYNEVLHYAILFAMQDELGSKDLEAFKRTHTFKRSIIILMGQENSPWWDDIHTDEKETKGQIMKKAFIAAYDSLSHELGDDPEQWHWGKVHTLAFKHPIGEKEPMDKIFNRGPYPVAGGNETVWQNGFSLGDREVRFGSQMRILIDMADPEHSWSVSPSGQSGNVMSPHYDDQVDLYIGGVHRREMMDREEIEKSGGDKLILNPN